MESLLVLVNIILAIILIIVILLQRSEGGALGLGVSQDNFTSARSVGNFLTKFTSIIATLFIICSIAIVAISRDEFRETQSVLEKKFNKDNIIIAYEPIWSIGTGKIPTKNELEETIIYIKKILKQIYKKKNPAVLYGGSVDGNSVKIFKDIKEIDGFLIGGASKSSKKFIDIIKNYYR